MKTILSTTDLGLDSETLHGIVGAIAAYTIEDLQEITRMDLTMEEYANISPSIPEMNSLIINRALGAYTRNLCNLFYWLGKHDQNSVSGP